MTKKGMHPCDPLKLKRIARLMQIHLLTHPERVARAHGFSAEYVRRQWRDLPIADMGSLENLIRRMVDE